MKNKKGMMALLAITLMLGLVFTGCGAFTEVSKVSGYLSLAQRVGRSQRGGPVPLAVKVNLNENWGNLLGAINAAGVPVNLDLSGCTMTNTEFNPGSNGSAHIVSLVLPNDVTGITGDFSAFTSLRSVSLPASVVLEANPFLGLSDLTFVVRGRGDLGTIERGRALVYGGNELVSYPAANGSITLNNITAVGRGAFADTEMWSIDLPSATSIGDAAFYGAVNLQAINIPAVVNIGNNIAANTGGTELTITVGSSLESIGTGMFTEITVRKNVIVKAPESAVESITAMREGFRGRGWNEGAFRLAAQRTTTTGSGWWAQTTTVNNFNTNINLTVEGY